MPTSRNTYLYVAAPLYEIFFRRIPFFKVEDDGMIIDATFTLFSHSNVQMFAPRSLQPSDFRRNVTTELFFRRNVTTERFFPS
jgi:hypothetical protein